MAAIVKEKLYGMLVELCALNLTFAVTYDRALYAWSVRAGVVVESDAERPCFLFQM